MSTFRDNFLGLEITLCQLEEERMTEFALSSVLFIFSKNKQMLVEIKKGLLHLVKTNPLHFAGKWRADLWPGNHKTENKEYSSRMLRLVPVTKQPSYRYIQVVYKEREMKILEPKC